MSVEEADNLYKAEWKIYWIIIDIMEKIYYYR